MFPRYYADSDVINIFKYLITHGCVTRHDMIRSRRNTLECGWRCEYVDNIIIYVAQRKYVFNMFQKLERIPIFNNKYVFDIGKLDYIK